MMDTTIEICYNMFSDEGKVHSEKLQGVETKLNVTVTNSNLLILQSFSNFPFL